MPDELTPTIEKEVSIIRIVEVAKTVRSAAQHTFAAGHDEELLARYALGAVIESPRGSARVIGFVPDPGAARTRAAPGLGLHVR
jgi:hypothetical protein